MAQLLGQQAMQPVEVPQQAGVQASPYAGLAKILQGYMAGSEEKEANEAYKNLAERYQTGNRADMGSFLEAMQGTPERAPRLDPQEVQQMADQSTPMPPNIPAQAPDRTRAMALALGSQNPTLQGAGGAMLSSMMTPKPPIQVAAGGTVLDPTTMRPIYTAPRERTGELGVYDEYVKQQKSLV
jgi:hypothetical protein